MNKYTIQLSSSHYSVDETSLIHRALAFAATAHESQRRRSGEPYIIHPLAVAHSLVNWNSDAATVAAGLLHDTVEDSGVTVKTIEQEFGSKVAELVDGVTKLSQIDFAARAGDGSLRTAVSNENIRKLMLAMTRDMRVMIIKLADRRHNLQTLRYLEPADQQRIAAESLEIYAPLADRLGMGQLKCEIEDLSFKYTHPAEYEHVKQLVAGYARRASRYITKLKRHLEQRLEAGDIEVLGIEGRQKHLFSVYKKLKKADGDIDKIYDLIAIRVIVPNESDCYKALGLIHQNFKPLIYRIKDYIAVPKPNGYRSLHTTVFALDGRIIEIQIRDPQMHEEAEYGLAAHFYYDSRKGTKAYQVGNVEAVPSKFTWVSNLRDIHAATSSPGEFVEALRLDLFQDRLFVFSPKGDLYDLPEGSTPIDFAFAVHSGIGQTAVGAKVNGRLVPLDTRLENRDVVEILTRKNATPHRDWLNFVRTPHAKNRIRAWFRAQSRDSNIQLGREALETELKAFGHRRLESLPADKLASLPEQTNQKDLDGVLASIGDGTLTVGRVMRQLFPPSAVNAPKTATVRRPVATGRVVVADAPEVAYVLAPCCLPSYPVPIIGYVTRGSGVTVHRSECPNLPDEPKRLVACEWELEGLGHERILCRLEIEASNRIGLLRDITSQIASQGVSINGLTSRNGAAEDLVVVMLAVEVADLYAVASLIKKLEHLPSVRRVDRIS